MQALEFGVRNGATGLKSGINNITKKTMERSSSLKQYIQSDLKQYVQSEVKKGWEEGKSQIPKKLK